MSDNINVKALSNLYTDPAKWGMWLCVGCITGIAEGNFLVFEAPCCRFPVFPAGTSILEKGMNSTDDNGRVHIVRRCAACLITAKGCIAVSKKPLGGWKWANSTRFSPPTTSTRSSRPLRSC